jgi:integrase
MKGCRFLDEKEIKKMLRNSDQQMKVFILTGLYFGTRVNESLKLTFSDFTGRSIQIKSSKGSDNISFDIPKKLKTEITKLKRYYEKKYPDYKLNDCTPVFLSRQTKKSLTRQQISLNLKKIQETTGIEGKIGSHSFRKCFVNKIYEMTDKDLIQTKVYSRHKNLSNLEYYIKSSNETNLIKKLKW